MQTVRRCDSQKAIPCCPRTLSTGALLLVASLLLTGCERPRGAPVIQASPTLQIPVPPAPPPAKSPARSRPVPPEPPFPIKGFAAKDGQSKELVYVPTVAGFDIWLRARTISSVSHLQPPSCTAQSVTLTLSYSNQVSAGTGQAADDVGAIVTLRFFDEPRLPGTPEAWRLEDPIRHQLYPMTFYPRLVASSENWVPPKRYPLNGGAFVPEGYLERGDLGPAIVTCGFEGEQTLAAAQVRAKVLEGGAACRASWQHSARIHVRLNMSGSSAPVIDQALKAMDAFIEQAVKPR